MSLGCRGRLSRTALGKRWYRRSGVNNVSTNATSFWKDPPTKCKNRDWVGGSPVTRQIHHVCYLDRSSSINLLRCICQYQNEKEKVTVADDYYRRKWFHFVHQFSKKKITWKLSKYHNEANDLLRTIERQVFQLFPRESGPRGHPTRIGRMCPHLPADGNLYKTTVCEASACWRNKVTLYRVYTGTLKLTTFYS